MFPLVHCCRWQRGTCCDSVKEKLQNSVSAEDTWAFTKATVKADNRSMYLLKHLQLPFQSRGHSKYWAQKSSSVSECLIKFLLFKLSKSDLDRLSLFSANVTLWLEFHFLILLYFQLHRYKALLPHRTESKILQQAESCRKQKLLACTLWLCSCALPLELVLRLWKPSSIAAGRCLKITHVQLSSSNTF